MTQSEWSATDDPVRLLDFLNRPSHDRKLRLFAVACCRRLWEHLLPSSQRGVEWAEMYADGLVEMDDAHARLDWETEGAAFHQEFEFRPWLFEDLAQDGKLPAELHARWADRMQKAERGEASELVVDVAYFVNTTLCLENISPYDPTFSRYARLLHTAFIRDIFGYPNHFVVFDPHRRTSTAIGLATAMYDSRSFDRMPILADSLQDAGCEDAAVLSHCRDPQQVHVRGCWVVDLVLNKG